MKKRLLQLLKLGCLGLLVLAAILTAVVFYVLSWPDFGGSIEGERLERVKASPQHTGERFENDPPPPPYDLMVNLREMMGDQERVPPAPFPSEAPQLTETPEAGLRAWWLGHATVLIEIDGYRVLTDPMLTEHAFPVHALAPARLNQPPISLEALPPIDAVTVSHDHYDHLDMKTVKTLAAGGAHFFVGLGVGAHLERWEVPAGQIHELDWWESFELRGLTIHCTPARHYSGRKSMSNATLWSSWVVEGPEHRIFHSGDSGYAPHFAAIGEKRGPIDVAFVKIGDYGQDAAWLSIHMAPESSIQAHLDLGAKVFFPIHWGTIQLSYHPWNEPIERATQAAEEKGVEMVTPRLGEAFAFGEPVERDRWWEQLGAP